jgi:hypothetical protein
MKIDHRFLMLLMVALLKNFRVSLQAVTNGEPVNKFVAEASGNQYRLGSARRSGMNPRAR